MTVLFFGISISIVCNANRKLIHASVSNLCCQCLAQRSNVVSRGFSVAYSSIFMALSKRYLISRFLMARPRTKCLSLVLLSIILYVVGSLICLHIRGNGTVKFPSNVLAIRGSNLNKIDLLHQRSSSAATRVSQGFDDYGEAAIGETVFDNELRKLPDIEFTNIKSNHSQPLRGPRRKFLFVFRYYEQLGRATNNLLDLASLAKNKNRRLVAPFVNNSRMSGLPGGVSHYFRKHEKPSQRIYASLSEYFDLKVLNFKLKARGYSTLNSFRDLESHCAKRFNIMIHFLFDEENYKTDTASWYRVSDNEVATMYNKAKQHNGWIDCSAMKQSRLSKQIGFKVSRYICVDPEVIRTASDLEDNVLKGANCVGIVQWRGTGEDRVHFPLNPSITQPLRPSDLEFNPRLVELARNFVKNIFRGEFIGIHVRSERHIERKGMNVTKRCMLKLATRVQETRNAYGIKQVFLASDLTDYGSDTLMNYAEANYRRSLSIFLHKALNLPDTFAPNGILYDTGAAAIVEMNILSMATRLFTLGGGNFQEWAVAIFLKRHNNEQTRVHRMCELV